jgi:hypothetical protein
MVNAKLDLAAFPGRGDLLVKSEYLHYYFVWLVLNQIH